MNTMIPRDAVADYTEAVRRERAAWQDLQNCAPGSDARPAAWSAWTDAIAETNRAWRKLNASKAAQAWGRAAPARQELFRAGA